MWIEDSTRKLNRKKAEITFSPHLFDRKEYWGLDLDKIEETVRNGTIFEKNVNFQIKFALKDILGKKT